jgi:hypothetical protein
MITLVIRIMFINFYIGFFIIDMSIYSLETNQRAKMKSNVKNSGPLLNPIDMLRSSVLISNVLYWLSIFDSILCFNVDTQEQHEILRWPACIGKKPNGVAEM